MATLDGVSAKVAWECLRDMEDAEATERLRVALSYKDSEAVVTVSDRYGIPTAAIYHWRYHREEQPVADAIEGLPRIGSPKTRGRRAESVPRRRSEATR